MNLDNIFIIFILSLRLNGVTIFEKKITYIISEICQKVTISNFILISNFEIFEKICIRWIVKDLSFENV